ncbi:cache domain-containing protein [Microbacterium terricola]|uniref:Cache domain-containing protein n=1 Tax=Microbacterium terricola TaxID=344163 RepID=A0ABM8E389_9MICO|nr:cache domain-containing protein [Microbacterium terricola]UYK40089.1 cache domain-containing protein [Microbacterium terricola]BDV32210.1 hypothetical protein Microterr_28700 [Microbacterium terricola]
MTAVTTRTPTEIADRVADTFDALFATIDGWRDLLEGRLAALDTLTAESVDGLVEEFAVPALHRDALITGAGFVATPGTLDDAEWHLAWWLGGQGALRRLATIDDPAHEQFRDYTALEWWRIPARTGARHLTGPYVDYVCTDDYAVTITTPVRVAGAMVGVVGTDALVDRLERELLPVLRSGRGEATIVNAGGRVVTSTDAHLEPGAILRRAGLPEALAALRAGADSAGLPDGGTALACGDSSLVLLIAA